MSKFKEYLIESDDRKIKQRWKQYLKSNAMLRNGVDILNKIKTKGYDAYIVGGGVRDIILGQEPHDIDISTNMPIEDLDAMFKTYDIGKSKDFGIVVVNQGGFQFEIAQLRGNENYMKPKTVRKIIK